MLPFHRDKMTVRIGEGGWERKDRFSSSFEGAAVNLVQGSSNATIRSLILHQCVGNGKGGQRRSLSRRVLPWHHETSTLLLNLSLPRLLLSRFLPRGGDALARCTHSRGQLQFLASNLPESFGKTPIGPPLTRFYIFELPIYQADTRLLMISTHNLFCSLWWFFYCDRSVFS